MGDFKFDPDKPRQKRVGRPPDRPLAHPPGSPSENPSLPEDEEDEANRQTRGLAGLALMLVLLIASLVVVRHLFEASAIQDCLMEGRANCVAVTASAP